LARLAAALAHPRRARPPWLRALLERGQTCLLGSVTVQGAADGPAYGLALPGQVVAYGLDQIVGVGATTICAACGRPLAVQFAI
jgi:hypothetical protein